MQQTNPSHVWSERCISLGHGRATRVGNRTGSVISRTTNHIDVRDCQPLKTGLYNSSICCGLILQSPERRSLFSLHIWCNRVEVRVPASYSVCAFMGKWLHLCQVPAEPTCPGCCELWGNVYNVWLRLKQIIGPNKWYSGCYCCLY